MSNWRDASDRKKLLGAATVCAGVVMLQREMAQLAPKIGFPLGDGWMRAKTVASLAIDEAVASFRHEGERLEAQGVPAHKVSTRQDLERDRRLEVEEILGSAVRKGAELGVPLLSSRR